MPEWKEPPAKLMHDSLMQVVNDLEDEVDGNPTFWAVIGIEQSELAEHAASAVAMLLQHHRPEEYLNPDTWVQCYVMGFVVGAKYGAKNAHHTPSG
jgi:hypothetical protein